MKKKVYSGTDEIVARSRALLDRGRSAKLTGAPLIAKGRVPEIRFD